MLSEEDNAAGFPGKARHFKAWSFHEDEGPRHLNPADCATCPCPELAQAAVSFASGRNGVFAAPNPRDGFSSVAPLLAPRGSD
jgi:hypothetical protein